MVLYIQKEERKVPTMKTLKTALIALIALIILTATATAETPETYRLPAVVTAKVMICADLWDITVTDVNGTEWGFFADGEEEKDYHLDDLVILIMRGLHEREEEDEVMDVLNLGTLTPQIANRWIAW